MAAERSDYQEIVLTRDPRTSDTRLFLNGDLQFGFYTLRDGGVTIQLTAPMTDDKVNAGPRGPVVETLEFALESETDGDGATAHTLVPQEGEPVILTPQLLGTTLVDQPFTWRSRPLNR